MHIEPSKRYVRMVIVTVGGDVLVATTPNVKCKFGAHIQGVSKIFR